VQAITDRLGVAAGALYRHFPSKVELFVEVFREAASRDLAARRAGSPITLPGEIPPRAADEDVDHVACKFWWRRAVTESHRRGFDRTVVLRRPGDGDTFKLGDVDLRVSTATAPSGSITLGIRGDDGPRWSWRTIFSSARRWRLARRLCT
jgi:hypothetical protein